jgi:hypothetical protein
MMNEIAQKDLQFYKKAFIYSSIITLFVIVFFIIISFYFGHKFLAKSLVGGLIGYLLVMANVFLLAFAFYKIAIKKSSSLVILCPALSFFTMVILGYCFSVLYPEYISGFAISLTSPLILGVILTVKKPA